MVEELLLDLARRHLKGPVEGLVGRDHVELVVQHEQGFANRLDDAGGHAARSLDNLLRVPQLGDVLKRQHEPVDGVLAGPIGQDPHEEPAPVGGLDFPLLDDERQEHVLRILQQPVIGQLRDDVRQGASDIDGDQATHPLRLQREPLDAQLVVQKDRGNLCTVQEILQIVVRVRERIELTLEFGVDGHQFLIEGLHLFLRCLQFLIGALQLFVGGLQFLVGGLQFLIGGLLFLDRLLQPLFRELQFLQESGLPFLHRCGLSRRCALSRGGLVCPHRFKRHQEQALEGLRLDNSLDCQVDQDDATVSPYS